MEIAYRRSECCIAMSLRPQVDIKAPSLVAKPAASIGAPFGDELKWEHLNETEKSAASLGVNPADWKPIGFMNSFHYEALLKSNALDDSLAKKLEAYKAVASGVA